MKQHGEVTHISVDGTRKTAIVRFKYIYEAENTYKYYREFISEGGKRRQIHENHPDAQIIYVIPEVSKDESYDPCQDESLTLEQIS